MKKEYSKPKFEIIILDDKDFITMSLTDAQPGEYDIEEEW